jgi:quinol monooxygenase YgiN
MLIRIVKLTFKPDKVNEFIHFFEDVKDQVVNFPGCIGMKLLCGLETDSNIVFTYSHWQSTEALESYRKSETFSKIWTTIKPWFKERPEAWSTKTHFDGF